MGYARSIQCRLFLKTTPPSLRLIDITKACGPVRVLDQARLSVRRGEVVALMGANGAGKSTLAKIAAGVVEPDNGRIFVAGKEVRLNSPRIARRHGIVVVHQSTNELGTPGLSVAENLVLDDLCAGTFGALAGKRKIKQRAKTVAAGIGLELELERDFGELGPAHRQLVAIARAVAASAAILILDEPTASLSTAEAARLFSVVDRLRGLGVGILYISHRLDDIRRLADRIVVLRNGQIVANQVRPLDLTAAIKAWYRRYRRRRCGKARWFPTGLVDESREQRAAEQSIRTLGIRCRTSRDTLDLLSGIARWQAAAYRLLLLDEPFQGVDVGARRDLITAIRAGRRDAATLVATSDVEEAIEVADVIAVMRNHTVAGLYDLRNGGSASFLAAITAVEDDEIRDSERVLV
jgi:ABC-type sugar transport system ATPase subunit